LAITISNHATVFDLKAKYTEAEGSEKFSADLLRMFFMGKDMKDNDKLYKYKIANDLTLQAMVKVI
jgi:hypothetical protein